MIFKQKIGAGEIRQINQAGKHIKIINAQSELQMRVFNAGGSLVLDSAVRSGFELTLKPFAYITIQSKIEQPFELWCSMDALGYDAPSENANNLLSYVAPHYGDTDPIVPFEPNRLSVKVVSNEPWFYGGSNVDKQNGIPVAAGEVAEIRGAAEISAAIAKEGEYLPESVAVAAGSKEHVYRVLKNEYGVFASLSSGFVKVTSEGFESLGFRGRSLCNAGSGVLSFVREIDGEKYICELNILTNKTKLYKIPDILGAESPWTEIDDMFYHDGKYVCSGKGKELGESGAEVGYNCIIIFDGERWVHKFKDVGAQNLMFRSIQPASGGKFFAFRTSKIYLLDVNNLPEIADFNSLEMLKDNFSGGEDYSQCTEHGGYFLLFLPGANSTYAVIRGSDWECVESGKASAAAISESGLLLMDKGKFKISEFEGWERVLFDSPHNFSWTERNHFIFFGGKLFCLGTAFAGYYVTNKLRVRPKQTFRLLKAYS